MFSVIEAFPPCEPALAVRVAPRASFDSKAGVWLSVVAAMGLPISLLWDYSWECTVGLDLFWSPPHVGTYVAAALALIGALMGIRSGADGVRIGKWAGPAGAWITLWGCCAFVAAVIFDRWWQGAYGLSAGIWHPPQLCKAVAFFAILVGVCARTAEASGVARDAGPHQSWMFPIATGALLAFVGVVNMTASLPNRQHGGWFYEISCACYPMVLLAASVAAAKMSDRFGATKAAAPYMLIWCVMLWCLPLFPAKPLVAPVYNAMDRMMPPSFPLLLIVPAICIDLCVSWSSGLRQDAAFLPHAVLSGLAFLFAFAISQWFFSEFLLSKAAAGWFFAGGGRHWPFFLKISDSMRQAFWISPGDELNESSAMVALFWSICSGWCGCWFGYWMGGLRR